jgi:hypothetical protein
VNDTPPKVEALMRELIMRRSAEERLQMCFSMFDFARELLESSLKEEGLAEGSYEFRRRYLERMYGGELRPEVIERIAARGAR